MRPSRVLEHGDEVSALLLSPNGDYLATASYDSPARIWETATGREVARVRDVRRIALSANGKLLATASEDQTAAIWDALSGRQVRTLGQGDDVVDMAFSRDGTLLATASYNQKSARVWDLETGQELARLVHDRAVGGVLFDSDARHVITRPGGATQGPVLVWESRTGELVQQLAHDNRPVQDFALSPDGARLATSAADKVRIYTVGQWDKVITAESPTSKSALAFSTDGQKLAAGGQGRLGSVEIISPSTGEMKRLAVHKGAVRFVAFTLDARHVVSVHQGQTASVWETDGGGELMRVWTSDQAHNSRAPAAFSPDGRLLIAIGESSVNYWPLFPADLVEEACHRLTRNLTHAEWKAFLPGERYRKTCPSLP